MSVGRREVTPREAIGNRRPVNPMATGRDKRVG
jgi:hypothetical protein